MRLREGLPFLLPLAMTAITVAEVSWNRSGGRGAIELSQRELPARNVSPDNTARSVWITHVGTWWWGGEAWLNREKLAEIGFDTSVDPSSEEGEAYYQRVLPRDVFVAMALDGEAWDVWVREYVKHIAASPPVPNNDHYSRMSRLVPVDVALDPETLESKYPDSRTHVIVRGVVRLMVYKAKREPARLTGSINETRPGDLHVPIQFAHVVGSPAYRLTIRFGRRYEPWIVDASR